MKKIGECGGSYFHAAEIGAGGRRIDGMEVLDLLWHAQFRVTHKDHPARKQRPGLVVRHRQRLIVSNPAYRSCRAEKINKPHVIAGIKLDQCSEMRLSNAIY